MEGDIQALQCSRFLMKRKLASFLSHITAKIIFTQKNPLMYGVVV